MRKEKLDAIKAKFDEKMQDTNSDVFSKAVGQYIDTCRRKIKNNLDRAFQTEGLSEKVMNSIGFKGDKPPSLAEMIEYIGAPDKKQALDIDKWDPNDCGFLWRRPGKFFPFISLFVTH
jgi:hypothetical protein